jgi:hypothetical protein
MKRRSRGNSPRWHSIIEISMPPWITRLLLGIALCAVLALAFVGYLRPSFVVDLANRIILCF